MVHRAWLLSLSAASLLTISAEAKSLEITRLINTINSIGVPVLRESGGKLVCKEGTLGAYIPALRSISICVRNHYGNEDELMRTIKHEGWHAVQDICNKNKPAFDDNVIRSFLSRQDKNDLHQYHPSDRRLEAEARLIEKVETERWIRGMLKYCY